MLYSLLRSPKCRQIGQIELNISVNGTAVTPVASGPDAAFVDSIVDNNTGDYTINLKEPSKMNLHVSSIVIATEDSTAIPFLVTKSSIQIKSKSVTGSPAAKDADFSVQIKFMDSLPQYF